MKHLFSPLKIGNLEIANRTVVPPMVTNYCNSDGTASERYITYHETRAKGGWGLIITEATAIDPLGRGFTHIAGLWNDKQIESHSELTQRVHQYDSKIFTQLFHAGRQTSQHITGHQPVAPSPIPCPTIKETPHELTIAEIQGLVEKFGDAALRAKKAEYDGIEIHGGHGYLIAQFMSPYSNKRCDRYGGSLKNRLRFPLEIIANIKEKAGKDFPISFRISGDEYVPGGRTIEDTKAIALILERAGVDAIHVSAGVYASGHLISAPAAVPHGHLVQFAAEVKAVVDIPVITVGRINDPFLAESILASNKADLIAMGRASLADPELPNKAADGRIDEINHCIGCLQGCMTLLNQQKPIQCLINPTLGRESEFVIKPALMKKKVLVAGGGPAGMEAAITAVAAGHEVELYEARNQLGGQFYLASIPPTKGELTTFIQWQINQLEQLGVKVHLNRCVIPELVEEVQPDAVIVATGARPIVPSIVGVGGKNVCQSFSVLNGNVDVGERVIIVGGGMVGAETAAYLANEGKQVTMIEELPEIANDMTASTRRFLLEELAKHGVVVHTGAKVQEITKIGVFVTTTEKDFMVLGDSVVLAVGTYPVNHLVEQLKGKPYSVTVVGDAVEARQALQAIEEGYVAGMQIGHVTEKELVGV